MPKITCSSCKQDRSDFQNSGLCQGCYRNRTPAGSRPHMSVTPEEVVRFIKAHPGVSLDTLVARLRAPADDILKQIAHAQKAGRSVYEFGNRWIVDTPEQGTTFGKPLFSDREGWHRFGAIGDTHLGSKHERTDELHDFYRIIEANGIRTVLHTGNYIDGESRFNRHELKVHGMDAQLEHMGATFPQVKGVTTYLVSGDDHEGWYAQREGIDIGRHMQAVMENGGRKDLKNLGYMECFVPLQHRESGKTAMVHVVHPGGGSAYAVSYTMQKQIEAYEGGEKPAIALAGHYHKAEHLEMRNVHGFQTGCFQDQTTFMRKKKLIATIGGWIIYARQNEETGAIEEVVSYFKGYYNRGYYVNNRWSLSGPASMIPRIKF